MTEWESVNVARGQFFSWGTEQGQQVTGKVTTFDASGDKDFQGNECPLLVLELTENSVSIKKNGDRTDLDAGSTVRLTVSQGDLKAALIKARPNPGDMVKITLDSIVNTKGGNTAKNFDVKIARGVAPAVQQIGQQQAAFAAQASDPWSDAQAPF